MFRKILVCLDGSEFSEQILRYASEGAIGADRKLVLLNVIPFPSATTITIPGNTSSVSPTLPSPEHLVEDEARAEEYLDKKAQPLKEMGIDVECAAIVGDPGETIVNYANENGIDLVAIATHGRSGLKRIIFGSVAEYVIKNSGLPILLIRPK